MSAWQPLQQRKDWLVLAALRPRAEQRLPCVSAWEQHMGCHALLAVNP